MTTQKNKISFQQFLEYFPELELPIVLSEESHRVFSEENTPLPIPVIQQYLIPIENDTVDEYTEFIPCFRIPKTHAFHAIVYWKAGLMTYEYVLVTLSKEGNLIHKETISGTKIEKEKLIRSVATIEDDWMIFVARGESNTNHENFDASKSQHLNLELLPDGKVIMI